MLRLVSQSSVIVALGLGCFTGCSGAMPNGGELSTGGALSTGSTGSTGSGGAATSGGSTASGSAAASGGNVASGGSASSGGSMGTGGSTDACQNAALVWKTAQKTNYTSYPDPGSEECIKYNGCMWAGQFAACSGVKSEEWVASHNIAALFPLGDYALHDICIKSGDKVMIVTVYDTCGDSDCNGCCTANKGSKDALVDLESYTNARWGLADGAIEWADLGPSSTGCN